MDSVFDDTLSAAAESFFELPGAEWITYRPRTGSSRRIQAVVSRLVPEALPGMDAGRTRIEILVRNDATLGISSATIDTGGDAADVALDHNMPPRRLRITEVLNHDAALMLLALQ